MTAVLPDTLTLLRRFELHRDVDVSGVSGVGVVAAGVVFPDAADVAFPDGGVLSLPPGWCRIVWMTKVRSTSLWSSVAEAMAAHGHDGATRLVWV